MRYYIISGEASGDLHGANLIRALRQKDTDADIRAWGGDLMEAAGATLVRHYRDLAFMGFVEVLRHLGTILRNLKFCKQDIQSFHPDVLVLIDYPGFNLRIASWAKQQGLRVVYYISPQVWAWKEGRVKTIRQSVDQMLVILPFEKAFYAKHDFEVRYVGHPLLERIREEEQKPLRTVAAGKPLVALLPGSRAMEIGRKLPVMLQAARHFPDYQLVVAGAPAQPDALYEQYIGDAPVLLFRNDTYNLLRQSQAALVTSGTATLETALLGVPQVVCYSGNPLSVWLARRLVKVPFISLVNLIMGREVVRELIQDDLNEATLCSELHSLLDDKARRSQIAKDYQALWALLEDGGSASEKAAEAIVMQAQHR
ncbi:MAG: lipid-A-disaccharide synthase [Bacteroidetes bacterium]|nr:lipid-A-disaccharide synthase [Bacteroidota bacterium]MBS1628418.1 lipid-A-disaccharide synthase [Bacteroidota bacterium]